MNPALRAIWVAQPVIVTVLLTLMFKKSLVLRFPAFTLYCAAKLVFFCALYLLLKQPAIYFYFFWASLVVMAVLGFAAIREVYLGIFGAAPALQRLASLIFQWGLGVLLFIAILSAATVNSSSELFARLFALDHAARFMQTGLIVLLFVIVGFTGLSFRDFRIGIGLGFGIFASVDLVSIVTKQYFGGVANATLQICSTTAFTISTITWVAYVLRAEEQPVVTDPRQLLEWNDALARLVRP